MSLPYPTPTRLALADAIAVGDTTAAVTARTAELAAAGLVRIDIQLTPDGMAWVTRARTSKISTAGEGPGSTSPEPGPPTDVCACPCGDAGHRVPRKPAGALSTEDGERA